MNESRNLTVWQGGVPAPTPEKSRQLDQQALLDHRQRIVFEVRTILSAYFQPYEDQAIKDSQLAWWCDELHDWEIDQIVWSLRKWNGDNPRLRPTPGDIVRILKEARGRKEAQRMALSKPATEPQRAGITDEERARRKAFAERVMSGYREKE